MKVRQLVSLGLLLCLWGFGACSDKGVGTGTCTTDQDCPQGVCRDGFCQGGCKTDAQCPGGGICDNGVCKSSSCKKNEDCPKGTACINGKCTNCQTDKECGPGRVCVKGTCHEGDCHGPDDPKGACASEGKICKNYKCTNCKEDKDCKEGQICVNGSCKTGCSKDEHCKEPVPVCDLSDNTCKECLRDGDCKENKVCDPATNTCKGCVKDEDCKDGKVCETHKCVPCSEDSQCGAGKICLNGACKPGCRSDADCKDGNLPKCDPTDKKCKECLTNKDCKDGKVCKANKCEECSDDSDCPQGHLCLSDGLSRACKEGDCRDAKKDCKPGQICKNNKCSECTKDGDCPLGHLCLPDGLSHACKEGDCRNNGDCKQGNVCIKNKCSPCAQDSDCPKGQICESGKCRGGCRNDSDCGNKQVCDKKTFTCKGCTSNSHCQGGQVCKNSRCVACNVDNDCDPGHLCLNGVCKKGNCRQHAECLNGQVCKNNQCVPCSLDADCPAGPNGENQICESGKCRIGCRLNSDCKDPKKPICDPASKTCKECLKHSDCTAGKICKNNLCFNCSSDADCPPGPNGTKQICDSGLCKFGCRQDADCTNPLKPVCDTSKRICRQCLKNIHCSSSKPICTNYTCGPCSSDSQCGAGKICVGGICKGGNCRTNADCAGQICKNNQCVPCVNDNECPTGLLCNKTLGTCYKCACRAHLDCGSTKYCDNCVCRDCPQVNISWTPTEGLEGRSYRVQLSIPGGRFPSPTVWRIVSGAPSWMKIRKTSEATCELYGTAGTAGVFNVKVEVGVKDCGCKATNTFKIRIWGKLVSLVSTYVKATSTCNVADVGKTIRGGKPPFSCRCLTPSEGGGTCPGTGAYNLKGVSYSNASKCLLQGLPSNSQDWAGSYGFIMEVKDGYNQKVEIPVVYEHKSCNDSLYTLKDVADGSDPSKVVPIKKAGSAYDWTASFKDFRTVCWGTSGSMCLYCDWKRTFEMTIGPLTAYADAHCDNSIKVCLDCGPGSTRKEDCFGGLSNLTCPAPNFSRQLTFTDYLHVRQHNYIRKTTSGKAIPSFQSFWVTFRYSKGLVNVGGQYTYDYHVRKCHWEVFEK